MFLTYNGVSLNLTSIDRLDRTTVFSDDGTTVLYVEHTLSASCVYSPNSLYGGTSVKNTGTYHNPARVSAVPASPRDSGNVAGSDPGVPFVPKGKQQSRRRRRSGGIIESQQIPFTGLTGNGPNPFAPLTCTPGAEAGAWLSPINTDRELELRLRVPRKKLYVWAFDTDGVPKIWIESPRNQNTVDAKVGPVVLGCNIHAGPNSNSFFVAIDIRTWLTPTNDDSDRAVLSHRWQMAHVEDENHYLSRVIKGQVVFNPGALEATKQDADWFRSQFFHPIPLGFQRHLGPVVLSPDGTTLNYEYTDTDVTCVFSPCDSGAARMEIVEHVTFNQPWRALE